VVLADDGPYNLAGGGPDRPAGPLVGRDVTIKADAGVRPVLRLAREALAAARSPAALLDFRGGHVTLEGLEFTLDPVDRDEPLATIRVENTELTVRRCLFRHPGGRARRGRVAALDVRATFTLAAGGDRSPAVLADACHFDGGQIGVLASGPVDVQLRDCTFGVAEPAVWCDNGKATIAVPAELRLQHDSLLAGEGPVFRFDGTAPRVRVEDSIVAPPRDAETTLVATDAQETLDWRGRGNLYARIGVFLQATDPHPGTEPIRDFAHWAATPSEIRETGSGVTTARVWEEADPVQALAQEGLNPTRVFRLAATSPGAADLGARQGPFGSLSPRLKVASNAAERAPAGPPAPATTAPEPGVSPPSPPSERAPTPANPPAPLVRMAEIPGRSAPWRWAPVRWALRRSPCGGRPSGGWPR
jgi:serine/threonine-protein kinase